MTGEAHALWNVRAQERVVRDGFDRQAAALESAFQATRELSALMSNPNFQVFLKHLQVLQDDSMKRLRDHRGLDYEVRQLQGRCMALQDVLDLCLDSLARGEELARKLRELQDARQRAVRPDGSVVPQGIVP